MMLNEIRAALTELGRAYGDRRLQLCRLDAATLDWGRCALTGTVLDAATLDEVVRRLAERFPAAAFDAGGVEVLRRSPPAYLYVATNLTGLYAEPSFLAEQLSELLNGQRLEVLREQERWCFVRQEDGYLGWAYRPYLTAAAAPSATPIVCEPVSLLRAGP
ncbi:MAG: SH3 domain-containing protein, partial [Anaerolineae bacterium]|nr:SH3 domain-containing protein [Anaerolineae bacterium]